MKRRGGLTRQDEVVRGEVRQKPHVFPDGVRLGHDNLVLHARARRHVVRDFPGPLSIKTVLDGQVEWIVEGRRLLVDQDSFLVLHDGQKYSMDVDVPQPVETCCVFFQRDFVERIAHDATTSIQASLDSPSRYAPPLHFLSRLQHDSQKTILPHIWSLAKRCSAEIQPSSFEEDFLLLSEKLVLLYGEISAQVARVPAMRAATREELYRRLQLAKEYMHGAVDQPVSLENVAKEACLSRYHMHRAFTKVFGQTPHAYITTLRLERARTLLKAGRSVTQVCTEVGLSSLSSFTRLFRSRYGEAPSSVAKQGRALL
jgi:AraC family transcriptional regulator